MSDWKNVQYKDGKYRTSDEGGGGGASTLAGLDDVDLDNLQDGQIIKWDATNEKFVNANESDGSTHTYSTTEQVISTWIDGKPVYEIVMQITTTSGNYTLDVSALHINEIIDFHIFVHNSTGGDYAFGSYWQASDDRLGWYLQSNKNNLIIRSGSRFAYGSGFLILRYTKTTD